MTERFNQSENGAFVPPGALATSFVYIVLFIDMMSVGLILPVLPELLEQLTGAAIHQAAGLAGFLILAYGIAQYLSAPVLGSLSDSIGRRPVLLLALGGISIDYLIMYFATEYWQLLAARVIAGALGASYAVANSYLTDITPEDRRAVVFARVSAVSAMGFLAGPVIGGVMAGISVRLPFLLAAAVSGIGVLIGLFFLKETLPSSRRRIFRLKIINPLSSVSILLSSSGVIPLVMVFITYIFATAVYPGTWTFWAIARFDWSPIELGLALSAVSIAMALTQWLLVAPAIRYLGEFRAGMIGLLAAAISTLGYGLTNNLTMFILMIVLHAPEGFVHPVLMSTMSRRFPADMQGTLMGVLSGLQGLTSTFGILFFSLVFSLNAFQTNPFLSQALPYFLAAAVFLAALTINLLYVKNEPSADA